MIIDSPLYAFSLLYLFNHCSLSYGPSKFVSMKDPVIINEGLE